MATVLSFPRLLPAIVADIATTRQRQKSLDAETIGRDLTDDEDALWSRLDDRRYSLEQEARAAIYAATGVSYDLIERALA